MPNSRLSLSISAFIFVAALTTASLSRAREVEVRMVDKGPDHPMQFDPELVRASPGDTIHFVAVDKGHYPQTIPGMIPSGAQPFSGTMGKDLTVTLSEQGVYGYQCTPHGAQGMVGVIVVGNPVNETAARNASVPAPARHTFDRLFAALDQPHDEHAAR